MKRICVEADPRGSVDELLGGWAASCYDFKKSEENYGTRSPFDIVG